MQSDHLLSVALVAFFSSTIAGPIDFSKRVAYVLPTYSFPKHYLKTLLTSTFPRLPEDAKRTPPSPTPEILNSGVSSGLGDEFQFHAEAAPPAAPLGNGTPLPPPLPSAASITPPAALLNGTDTINGTSPPPTLLNGTNPVNGTAPPPPPPPAPPAALNTNASTTVPPPPPPPSPAKASPGPPPLPASHNSTSPPAAGRKGEKKEKSPLKLRDIFSFLVL